VLPLAAGALLASTSTAAAGLFVTTGQTGAQVQCDVSHTQHWTFQVTADVAQVDGALFTMKRGSATDASITFRVFEGTLADAATAKDLLSVTLASSSFSQSFSGVLFQDTKSITLKSGRTYTGVLASSAPDAQSRAYFIKGGSNAVLSWCDETGGSVSAGAGLNTISVPTPASFAIFALTGVLRRRRR
jgi:hypothetical protein